MFLLHHAPAMDLVTVCDCEICQHYPGVVCGSCGVRGNLHGVVAYVAVTVVTCVGPTQTTIVMFQRSTTLLFNNKQHLDGLPSFISSRMVILSPNYIHTLSNGESDNVFVLQ